MYLSMNFKCSSKSIKGILSLLILTALTILSLPAVSHPQHTCFSLFSEIMVTFNNLPHLSRIFIGEADSVRNDYLVSKSKLESIENSPHIDYGISREKQSELVRSNRLKALIEMVELLKRDPELADLPAAEFRRIAEANIEWSVDMPALDMARYQLYLLKTGIDPFSTPNNLGSIFSHFQYPILVHQTNLEHLVAILKSGELSPRAGKDINAVYETGEAQYLYLEAYMKAEENRLIDPKVRQDLYSKYGETFAWMFKGFRGARLVFLAIDSTAVDAGGFSHMSGDWNYGKFYENKLIRGNYVLASYLNAIDKTSGQLRFYQPRNEILLTKPISLKEFLRGINVHPGQVAEIKNYLRENGVEESLISLVQ